MVRTKKAGQRLGGQLQSARAKHDTALEEEILGKMAAAKPPKAKKTKKAEQTNGAEGEEIPALDNSPTGALDPKLAAKKAKKKRATADKKEVTTMLVKRLTAGERKPSEVFKRASTTAPMQYLLEAARALGGPDSGKITEADFVAKVLEFHTAAKQSDEGGPKAAAKKENKAARQAATASTSTLKVSGQHNDEPQRNQHLVPVERGFSTEFWLDLAGSREAAAVAAM